MENMFLWSLILVFSVISFNFNFTLSGVNRAFLGLLKAIPMNSVIAYSENGGEVAPYFDEAKLEEGAKDYLLESLRPYGVEADLLFDYKARAPLKASGALHNYVSLTMVANLGLYGEFTKSLHFSIEESPK
ncbi:MAG: hypothetical protein J6328_07115 [Bacilli bacterium]|nr:hypothetical protein [Bacilli bacterium]